MTSNQSKVLKWAIFAVVLISVYPPWIRINTMRHFVGKPDSSTETASGYTFIFNPPTDRLNTDRLRNGDNTYRIDLARLSVEFVSLSIITTLCFLIAGGTKSIGGSKKKTDAAEWD